MRKYTVLGLDVGAAAVKAVEMTRAGDRLDVVGCSYEDVSGPDGHADAVRAVLAAGGHDARHVAVGLSGRGTLLRVVSIPGDNPHALERAVREEVEKLVPYSLDQACFGWQLLPGEHDRFVRVLAAASRRDAVYGKLDVLDQAGVVPMRLDLELAALANALETANYRGSVAAPGRGAAVVDFGASKTLIAVTDGARHLFRDFPVGGDKLTEMIAHRMGCQFDEAEQAKRRPGERIETVKDAIYPGLEDIAAEVRSCIDQFRAGGGGEVDAVLLSGGLVAFPGIPRLMDRMIRVPARVFDFFGAANVDGLDDEFMQQHGHRFAVAFGLACHAKGDGK